MEKHEALAIVIDMATRWGENAEEGLPTRISPEMLTNDKLWESVLAGMDEFERDQGYRTVRLVARCRGPAGRRLRSVNFPLDTNGGRCHIALTDTREGVRHVLEFQAHHPHPG